MSQRFTIPSLQGTFTKRSMPMLQPNFAKEPFSPSHFNPKFADAKETKNSAPIEVKCLIMNKAQHTTRGIKHWGLGGYSNIQPRIKFSVTGQESSPQSPTISYRNRYR